MHKIRSNGFWRRWLPVILTATTIFILSSQSPETLKLFIPSKEIAKVLHVVGYFLLSLFLLRALRGNGRMGGRIYLTVLVLVLAYAILDEGHQTLVLGRDGNLMDVVIDCLGAIAGVVVYELIKTVEWVDNFLEWGTGSSLD